MAINKDGYPGFQPQQIEALEDIVLAIMNDRGLGQFDNSGQFSPLTDGAAYAPPEFESPLAAKTPAANASVEFIQTVINDGYAFRVNWAGNSNNNTVTMGDGTEFIRYPQGTGGTQILAISAQGGPVNGQAFTPILTISNSMDHGILLRDETQDIALLFMPTGSDSNWQLECWALDSEGNVLTHYVLPPNGFLERLTTNPYLWGGIGTDGKFSLWQPYQYGPAQSMSDRAQTLNVAQIVQVGQYVNGQFVFDSPFHIPMEERWGYHSVFHGLAGNPHLISCLVGRDVLDTEDHDFVSYLTGTTSNYHFDQIGLLWFDTLTKRHGFVKLTPKLGFLNNVAKAYVAYNSGATQITVLENVSGTLRVGQTLAHVSGVLGGGVTTGIPVGATITSWASGTGGPGSVANISAATTAASSYTEITSTDPTPATPQKRFYQATIGKDGYIRAAYFNVRQYSPSAGAALSSANSYRIMKVSGYGHKLYDWEYLGEGSGQAYGYHTTWETDDGRMFVIRVANGNNNTTEVHACRVWENVTGSADGCSTASSTTFTVGGTVTGRFDVGMYLNHPNYPTGTYITKRGTGTGGAGTYITNNAATATASGLTVTARAPVVVEPPCAQNTLNSWWGTYATYMGVPQTLPARASGFLAMVGQRQEGSKMGANWADFFISRKENDNPTNTSPSGNAERLELVRVIFPD